MSVQLFDNDLHEIEAEVNAFVAPLRDVVAAEHANGSSSGSGSGNGQLLATQMRRLHHLLDSVLAQGAAADDAATAGRGRDRRKAF